jgi:hypothetical protein
VGNPGINQAQYAFSCNWHRPLYPGPDYKNDNNNDDIHNRPDKQRADIFNVHDVAFQLSGNPEQFAHI